MGVEVDMEAAKTTAAPQMVGEGMGGEVDMEAAKTTAAPQVVEEGMGVEVDMEAAKTTAAPQVVEEGMEVVAVGTEVVMMIERGQKNAKDCGCSSLSSTHELPGRRKESRKQGLFCSHEKLY